MCPICDPNRAVISGVSLHVSQPSLSSGLTMFTMKRIKLFPWKNRTNVSVSFQVSHTHTHTRKNESINSFHVKDGKLNTCIIFHHLNCKSQCRLQAVKKKFYGICAKNNTGPKKTSKQYDNKTRYYCQPYSV